MKEVLDFIREFAKYMAVVFTVGSIVMISSDAGPGISLWFTVILLWVAMGLLDWIVRGAK